MTGTFSMLLLFLTAVSVDSLTAGLTYGTQKVRIKLPSLLILACIPAVFIAAANRAGSCMFLLIPRSVLAPVSFCLLFLLGFGRLSESLLRAAARKNPGFTRHRGCRFRQLNIIFTVYLSPEDANRTDPQILSPKEALLLSLALSLDSVFVGMAFTAVSFPPALLFLAAALFNLLLFCAGYGCGFLLCRALHADLSWLSGLCLLLLAFQNLW